MKVNSTMQTYFYISYGKENIGPFTIEEIIEKIKSDEISPTGYLYDEDLEKWISFLESDVLKSRFNESGTQSLLEKVHSHENGDSAALGSEKSDQSHNEWYVLRGTRKHGPYDHLKIFRMLQEKKIYEFDFVWKPGLSDWMRIAEIECFQSHKVKELQQSGTSNVFFRRRFFRFRFFTSIIVHDNKSVWKGESFEISEGGAGIIVYNSTLKPIQRIHIHFKPEADVPSFNSLCEVVSKKYKKGVVKKNTPTKYGVKFIDTHSNGIKTVIQRLADTKSA